MKTNKQKTLINMQNKQVGQEEKGTTEDEMAR